MPDTRYDGVWTVMDTGPAVQGRVLDLYMWSCNEALRFGRRPIELTVLRLGWNPQNSAPGKVGELFKRREIERARMSMPESPAETDDPEAAPAAPAVATVTPPPKS
jgi:hypothetical protein